MNPVLKAKKLAKELSRESDLKLKDALAELARKNGFSDWKSYKDSIDTFWYEKKSPFLNHWFTTHAQAKDFREREGGFLLTYKGQFFVASADYMVFLGLNPKDPVWERINFDVSDSSALDKFQKYYGTTRP